MVDCEVKEGSLGLGFRMKVKGEKGQMEIPHRYDSAEATLPDYLA